MSRTPAFVAALAAYVLIAASAHAEMGPCRPDDHESFICGSGNGAARVIEGTLSPSKRLALAWRGTKTSPTEEPDDDNIEILVVRLADGAVLAKTQGSYWNTGESRANRLEELATWSPNSRFLIRSFNSRFSTDNIDLYAFGANDEVTGPFDLLKAIEPAVGTRMRQERVKKIESYVLSVSNEPPLSIDNGGRIRASLMMWVPKEGPERDYKLNAQVARGAKSLAVRIGSITLTHVVAHY
jgi:hypothetical protein